MRRRQKDDPLGRLMMWLLRQLLRGMKWLFWKIWDRIIAGLFPQPEVENPTEEQIQGFYQSRVFRQESAAFKRKAGINARCGCCSWKPEQGVVARFWSKKTQTWEENYLVTDHIKPVRKYWKLRMDKSNWQILCNRCNLDKGSRHEIDFRRFKPKLFGAIRERMSDAR